MILETRYFMSKDKDNQTSSYMTTPSDTGDGNSKKTKKNNKNNNNTTRKKS